jgi:hypothetical protein
MANLAIRLQIGTNLRDRAVADLCERPRSARHGCAQLNDAEMTAISA